MTVQSRGAMLADLAGLVNELVEPRHHAEIYETEVVAGVKRKRVRRRHITTLPPLLAALEQAAHPEVTGETGTSVSFESRSPAADEAIHALRLITDGSAVWARALAVTRETLPGRLRGLVGASMSDSQLDNLLFEARGWVKVAKAATREDAPNRTLDQPCPYCWRKNSLTIAGDLTWARCTRCGADWDDVTVGLLAQMLEQNQTVTVLAARCEWPGCYRVGEHDVHWTGDGRYWRETCPAEQLAP